MATTGRARLRSVLRRPVVVAPMAGGPTTVELVVAAAGARALGVLAAGYRTAAELSVDLVRVRQATDEAFGVNVFVPGAPTADTEGLRRYVATLSGDADAVGAPVGRPEWDDDDWDAKVQLLLHEPPPLVSFTFGCPDSDVIAALRSAGSVVAVTVTALAEAVVAAAAGADCLVVQGSEAGAHRATFTNDDAAMTGQPLGDLVSAVAAAVDTPIVASGGIMGAGDTARMLAAGACAVQCGTAFLRCPESGAHPVHKEALADPHFGSTAVTRAFSGRPARGLANRFMADHPDAPAAYPEVNGATRPLRAAAARLADRERMSLWAGTGFAEATDHHAAEVVELLVPAGS